MKHVFIAMLAVVMSGCATMGNYGNFLPEEHRDVEAKIAEDAVKQLVVLYPPARSRIHLQHEAKGTFGLTFVEELRKEGYAVKEYGNSKEQAGTGMGLALGYILDVAGAPDLYRLIMVVGDQSISRPYMRQGTTVVPAGYWALKE
jgi:hypothetical protein